MLSLSILLLIDLKFPDLQIFSLADELEVVALTVFIGDAVFLFMFFGLFY